VDGEAGVVGFSQLPDPDLQLLSARAWNKETGLDMNLVLKF
jgi:hypothetical protein